MNSWCKKGYTLVKLGKNQEALECLDKALELDPDFELAKIEKEKLLSSNP